LVVPRMNLAIFLIFFLSVQSQLLPLPEYYALQNLSASIGVELCSSACDQCGSWAGIQCSGPSVIQVNLSNRNLFGIIPSQIGSFSQLQLLDFDTNNLEGTIPSEIGMLSQISELYLYSNKLSGTIPSQLGVFTLISELYLNNNKLSGTIPSQIGKLNSVEDLVMGENDLSGEIPPEIANLPFGIFCNLWFGNNLFCDPSYPPGITRCLGTTGLYDYNGATDGPHCPPIIVPYTVTFNKFPGAQIVRVQYRIKEAKEPNWSSTTVDGTKTSALITGLLANTVYEYRLVVQNLVAPSPPVGPTLTFTTPTH